MGRIIPFAPEAAAEGDRRPHRLEHVGGELLRHESDHGAGGTEIGNDVVTVDGHAARRWLHDPADDVDQGGLAGAVGAEQGEDFASPDVEVDAFQGLEP